MCKCLHSYLPQGKKNTYVSYAVFDNKMVELILRVVNLNSASPGQKTNISFSIQDLLSVLKNLVLYFCFDDLWSFHSTVTLAVQFNQSPFGTIHIYTYYFLNIWQILIWYQKVLDIKVLVSLLKRGLLTV